jgi:hypothetical protein
MNQENLDFYKEQLKYAGFGERLNDQLGRLFTNDDEKTVVFNTSIEYGKDAAAKTVNYDLRFQRSATSSLFFLNNYSASMEKSPGELVSNTFYLDRAKGITAKEAFNLLEGRSVYKELKNKEGETYTAWVKLNPELKDEKGNMKFSMFNDNYGYDLTKSLEKVQTPDLVLNLSKEDTLKSLQKGNLVELHSADKKEKIFIAADPQYKTMAVFNEAGEKQFVNNKQAESVSQNTSVADNTGEKVANSVKR